VIPTLLEHTGRAESVYVEIAQRIFPRIDDTGARCSMKDVAYAAHWQIITGDVNAERARDPHYRLSYGFEPSSEMATDKSRSPCDQYPIDTRQDVGNI
jgi:hypothetical protein